MLTERLRTLEGAALVKRDYEPTIPPKVTYSLTKRGGELDDVMDRLGGDRNSLGGGRCGQPHWPRAEAAPKMRNPGSGITYEFCLM